MKTTDKYGLNKPESTDIYNVEDFNANMDIIDGVLKRLDGGESDTTATIAALNDGLVNTNKTITDHVANKLNPHVVTAAQVGLGNVPNVTTNDQTPTYTEPSSISELSSGEKLSIALGKIATAVKSIISHLANKNNPHGVTASQVGLGNVNNTADTDKPVSTAQSVAIADAKSAGTSAQTIINNHATNKNNPHGVTASQIGLGNVNNTSDANKPVSTAQATAIADAKAAGTSAQTTINSHLSNKNNPHTVTAEQVGLGNVPNVATNDQTPTYTVASSNTALSSGEKLSVAFGKIAKAINSLISHLSNRSNPHGVTVAQVGAVTPYTLIGSATGKTEIEFNTSNYYDIVATVRITGSGRFTIPIITTGEHRAGYYASSSDNAGINIFTTDGRGYITSATYAGSNKTDSTTISFYGRAK